jgi:hypothetical protein
MAGRVVVGYSGSDESVSALDFVRAECKPVLVVPSA